MAEESLETFWGLIEHVDVCMMTTWDAKHLMSRPMAPKIDRGAHEFFFLAQMSSFRTEMLAGHPDVNLGFCDPDDGTFVSVSGQAYVTRDRKLIDALWSDGAGALVDASRDDPDLCVIRVVPSRAEYWDGDCNLKLSWNVFKAKSAPEPEELASDAVRPGLAG
jgi:general stress protein 26